MVNIPVSRKVWWFVRSVITGQAGVANGTTILKSETAETSMCTSYRSHRHVHYVTVATNKVRIGLNYV